MTNRTALSEDLKELLASVEYKMQINKGSYIFQEGLEAKELYIVRSGKVQISKISADGQELTLRICSKHDIIGELTLFTDNAKYLLNSKCLEDVEVGVIKRDALEKALLEKPALAFEFMKWISEHLRRMQTKFRDLVLHGKKGALYSTLIRMTNSYGILKENGILIDLPLTNQELANFCATSRESVNRMLNDLKKQGIISIHKGKITIHNLQFLKCEIACEDCPTSICSIE
ncbi:MULTISPECIES: Crp/Fnr family transcriptional regulator [Bacillus]|uniref:Crp/Fnr family transcriptional regulator n=1 Tax=Bacillus TaxID=1386 RepID=UPI0002F8AACE|nr:Crp/Fnr family transcriptional regulator [Bacillus pseudomycoides]MED1595434.1 Crp/Fnr family transcriptional regulator [Bacillus pseudomycoides]MED4712372.1 Crp/Fnr family transcriptional regulator [Bacillus pseudomycoides]OOR52704.1 Crp/Fnr family transcriptional regulator [Bacillus pseudomycoides]PDY09205.1 Crp/Fnr family transcriptional regulator [Bacillus pseudomycoides]PEF75395.1 Crp/Fnr family transcriptional regulator [Bacillus pseudomycoides]